MKKYLYPLLSMALISACGGSNSKNNDANLLAINDFESFDGWTGDKPLETLTKDKAHSGKYAVQVRPGAEFSNGYLNPLVKLSPIKLTKVKVHAWVYSTTPNPSAILVTRVMNPNSPEPLMTDMLELRELVKSANKWTEVEKVVTLPETAGPNHKLFVYLWSAGTPTPVYLDDLEIYRAE